MTGRKRARGRRTAAVVGVAVLGLAGCTAGGGPVTTPAATPTASSPSTSMPPGSATPSPSATVSKPELPAGTTMSTVLGDPWSKDVDVQNAVIISAMKIIDGAPKGATVMASIFNMTFPGFDDTLIKAHDRGVKVRVLVNKEKSGRSRYDALKRELGRNTKADSWFVVRGGGIRMHSKFVLASTSDGVKDVVWMSSGNMTKASGKYQANEALQITGDAKLYDYFATQFDLMSRGVTDASALGRSATTPTARVQAYPIPKGGEQNDPVSAMLKDITCVVDGKHTTVRLAQLFFTDDRLYIADRLRELKSQGCDIRAVGHMKQWDKARRLLVQPGAGQIDLRSAAGAALHTKIWTIDGWDAAGKPLKIAMVGSHNLTGRALTRIPEGVNDEFSITVDDPATVDAYSDWVDWVIAKHSTAVSEH